MPVRTVDQEAQPPNYERPEDPDSSLAKRRQHTGVAGDGAGKADIEEGANGIDPDDQDDGR